MMNYPNGRIYKEVTQHETSAVRHNKYNAHKTVVDGITFDSRKEAKRYAQLKVLEQAGEITDLRLQVPFILIPKSKYGRVIKYIADFTYNDVNGCQIVEDTKGIKTPVYRLKKRMMQELYGIEIKET